MEELTISFAEQDLQVREGEFLWVVVVEGDLAELHPQPVVRLLCYVTVVLVRVTAPCRNHRAMNDDLTAWPKVKRMLAGFLSAGLDTKDCPLARDNQIWL
jgi:hypothetical protein